MTFADLVTAAADGDEGFAALWDNDDAIVTCAAADGFSFTRSVGDLKAGRLYKWDGTDDYTAVTPCLGLKWKSGAVNASTSLATVIAANIAAADEVEAPRAIYGITEAEYANPGTIPPGNKQVSYIAEVIITAPAA